MPCLEEKVYWKYQNNTLSYTKNCLKALDTPDKFPLKCCGSARSDVLLLQNCCNNATLLFNALRRLPPLSCINLSHSEVKLIQKAGELSVFKSLFCSVLLLSSPFQQGKRNEGARLHQETRGTQFLVGRNTQKSMLYINKLFRISSNSFLSHFAPLLLLSLPLSLTHSLLHERAQISVSKTVSRLLPS